VAVIGIVAMGFRAWCLFWFVCVGAVVRQVSGARVVLGCGGVASQRLATSLVGA